jgi:hypothetical protein
MTEKKHVDRNLFMTIYSFIVFDCKSKRIAVRRGLIAYKKGFKTKS